MDDLEVTAEALNNVLEQGGFLHRVSANDLLSSSVRLREVDAAVATADVSECYNMMLSIAEATPSACITGRLVGGSVVGQRTGLSGLGYAIQTNKSTSPKIACTLEAGAACGAGSFSELEQETAEGGSRVCMTVSKHLFGAKVLRLPGGLPPHADTLTYFQRLDALYNQLVTYPDATLCVFEGKR
jgi:hypothetical protein